MFKRDVAPLFGAILQVRKLDATEAKTEHKWCSELVLEEEKYGSVNALCDDRTERSVLSLFSVPVTENWTEKEMIADYVAKKEVKFR